MLKQFFLSIPVVIAAMAAPANVSAELKDAEGFPVLYLRGDMTGTWGVAEEWRFTRQGDTYTLNVAEMNGEFKISDEEWGVEYGSTTGNKESIYGSCVTYGAPQGANFIAENLKNVKISFTYYDFDPSFTEITFVVDNQDNPSVPGISGTLPVLYINVRAADGSFNDEIISKDLDHKNYFAGEYWLDLNGCEWMEAEGAKSIGSKDAPLPLEIKARGNYTRKAFSKKPFKLKLGAKQSMLGLSKSKHFAILAHADDNKGYMRNFTGFNLGRRIGLPWTPWQQPVEVVINGDYRGLYFLTESIRVGDGRVPVSSLEDNETDPALASGGYLIELDNYDEENQIRMEEKGQAGGYKDMLRITFDTPEVYSDIQYQFVNDQFTAMNDLIGDNSDNLWRYMDLDDAARYYLVEEIISHTEAYHGSTYMFRERGEGQKWHFSPLWDCGNAFNGPTDGFFYDNTIFGATWIPSLRLNAKFNDKVRETWLWFMSNGYKGIMNDLDEYAAHIKAAARADHKRWDGMPTPADGLPVADNSDMSSRLAEVKSHLDGKVNWLKGVFGDFEGNTFAEPERDATPAAELPVYILAGIDSPEVEAAGGAVEYYNLQGIRITEPCEGEIYIIRTAKGSSLHLK